MFVEVFSFFVVVVVVTHSLIIHHSCTSPLFLTSYCCTASLFFHSSFHPPFSLLLILFSFPPILLFLLCVFCLFPCVPADLPVVLFLFLSLFSILFLSVIHLLLFQRHEQHLCDPVCSISLFPRPLCADEYVCVCLVSL